MSRWRTQLDLRASFVALLCACVYFGGGELLAVFLPAAVLHELGHILAARCMGLHIRRLTLSALGAELRLAEENTSFLQDLLLCVSGPAVNLLLAAACAVLGCFPLFLGANLLLFHTGLRAIFLANPVVLHGDYIPSRRRLQAPFSAVRF